MTASVQREASKDCRRGTSRLVIGRSFAISAKSPSRWICKQGFAPLSFPAHLDYALFSKRLTLAQNFEIFLCFCDAVVRDMLYTLSMRRKREEGEKERSKCQLMTLAHWMSRDD